MFCKELGYLSNNWETKPILRTILLSKIWSFLYFVIGFIATACPVALYFKIFPNLQTQQPLGVKILLLIALIIAFFVCVGFNESHSAQKRDLSIYTETKKFTDAITCLIKAVMHDREATLEDIRHLTHVKTSRSPNFPDRVQNILYKELVRIAEAIKEYDLLPGEEKSGFGNFTYELDKKYLKNLLGTCHDFGLFEELSPGDLYIIAKKNIEKRKSDPSEAEV